MALWEETVFYSKSRIQIRTRIRNPGGYYYDGGGGGLIEYASCSTDSADILIEISTLFNRDLEQWAEEPS